VQRDGQRRPEPAPAGRGILVVDDHWLISHQIEQALTGAGYRVVGITDDAVSAMDIAGRERPDLVLMDIRLNGDVDGVEAARAILDRLGIRSVFVSAHTDAATVARTEAARPLGWLPKPFTDAELLAAVRAALAAS
jgi:DNA-binding NarL/FixJ family response regulator